MPRARELKKAQRREEERAGAGAALESALGLLEHLPLPVFVKDRDGRYLAVNRAWEEFFGIARAKFVGKRVGDLYPQSPETAARHAEMDAQLWSGPGGQSYEIPITMPDGRVRHTVYYKASFGRDFTGLLGVIVDITGRREAEEALRHSKLLLEQVFEHMDQGISVADGSLRMVAMNRRFRELLELPESLCQPNTPFESFLRYNAQRGEYGPGNPDEQVRTRLELARTPKPHRFVRQRPDGTMIEVRGVPLPGGGFVSVYTDVTERTQSEARLRESEERFRRSWELAGSGFAHIGMDRKFVRVNRKLCEILGRTEAELLGHTAREFSHPDDLDIINSQRKRLYAGELDTVKAEKRYLRKDGSSVWVAFTMVPERDASGRPVYEICVFDDVTQRKEAETRLRESEERFRAVVDSANEGILAYDKNLKIVGANQAAERIVGLPLADIRGAAGFTSLLPCINADGTPLKADDRPTRITIRTGKTLTGHIIGIRRQGGATTWLSINTAFLRHPGASDWYGIVSTIADVTAARDAELRLRESEERFRQTFELAGSGIAHVIDQRFVRVNRSLCEILGRSEKELIGMSVKEVSHPEDRDVTDADRARIARREIDSARFEKRYLRGDGSVIWAEIVIALVRDAAGRPLYEIAIFDDITERRLLDDALREKTAILQLGQSTARMIVLAYDIASDELSWSDSPEWLRGPLPASGRYPTFREQVHPDDQAQFLKVRQESIDTLSDRSLEFRMVRTDAQVVWVLARQKVLTSRDGKAARMLVALIDITERKHAEAELRQAHDELARSNAELEQFAYVASHDLQEPLRMVSSYTQLVTRRYGERLDGDAREFMGYVVDGAARMKQLIEDLLAYSRVGTKGKEFQPVAVDAPLKRAVTNLRSAMEESSASVTWDPLPTVLADESQLAQLFQNLIGNALKFRSASVPRIHVSFADRETEYEFAVTDNGIGIEQQYFERIFMVFQRLHNKAEYPGTGIGLAICKKVVERHGGQIWVESKSGEGTTFRFTLPKEARHG